MKPLTEEERPCSSYTGSFLIQHGGVPSASGSMSASGVRKSGMRGGSDIGGGDSLSYHRPPPLSLSSLPPPLQAPVPRGRCLSRLTVLTSLLAAVLLTAAIVTDRWIYTTEPLRWANSSTVDTSLLISFRSGLWRTCSQVNFTNDTVNARMIHHSHVRCVGIPLWPTDMTSQALWREAEFTGTFLDDMRLSTPFIAAALILVGLAVLTSLIGHCLQDVATLLAAILLVLAGLTLGGGLVIFMTSLASSYAEQAYYRKSIVGVRLYYSYGLSFYSACLTLVLEELAAMFGISAYLRHFRSREELFRVIPGLERARVRRLSAGLRPSRTFSSSSLSTCSAPTTIDRKYGGGKKKKSGKKYIRMSKTESSLTGSSLGSKTDSRRTLKEDLTLDNLTHIECVTVAL